MDTFSPKTQLWVLAFVVELNFREEGILSVSSFSTSVVSPDLGHILSQWIDSEWKNGQAEKVRMNPGKKSSSQQQSSSIYIHIFFQ